MNPLKITPLDEYSIDDKINLDYIYRPKPVQSTSLQSKYSFTLYIWNMMHGLHIEKEYTFSRELLEKETVAVSLVRTYRRCGIFIKSSLWKRTQGMVERLQLMFQMMVDIQNTLSGYTHDKTTLKYYSWTFLRLTEINQHLNKIHTSHIRLVQNYDYNKRNDITEIFKRYIKLS